MENKNYDFAGWATRYNIKCTDGRTILKGSFKHLDGKEVPIMWQHMHSDPSNVLGKAVLKHCDEGVMAYGSFNDSYNGQHAKEMVKHGDITALSIHARGLKYKNLANREVSHGNIHELSLVMAGANSGAYITDVAIHSDDSDEGDEAIIFSGYYGLKHSDDENEIEETEDDEEVEEKPKKKSKKKTKPVEEDDEDEEDDEELEHSLDSESVKKIVDGMTEEQRTVLYAMIGLTLQGGKIDETSDEGEDKISHVDAKTSEKPDKTVDDVIKSMTEEQLTVLYGLVAIADELRESGGGNEEMKQNAFDISETNEMDVLTHEDGTRIIEIAKRRDVGSLQHAISEYYSDSDTLSHGIEDLEVLFPEYKDVKPGAPELLTNDQSWVDSVMNGVHKSPISRIRTRHADARTAELRAKGYNKKGNYKPEVGNIKLLQRTTDPQTIFIKDSMHRDDIIDMTDFDVVAYNYAIMRNNLKEELATAILIGDGREEGDPDKIYQEHIRSIWHDDDLYTIHYDIDVEAARRELQGSDTSKHFSENYIYAEALITASLYSREKYKGSGNLKFYCTPHLLNVMLLARDFNGRRIYSSKAELTAALNVSEIITVEQFEGKTRTDKEQQEKKLLGIFVNWSDYYVGATKGGEITNFQQFDIDFNLEKYLIETRLSGALVKPYAAIVLEEPVVRAKART